MFEGGNLTEEYGTAFAVWGMVSLALGGKASPRLRIVAEMAGGLLFASACFAKEPFVVLVAPWTLLLCARAGWNSPQVAIAGVGFSGSCSGCRVGFWLPNTMSASFADWIDVLSFNSVNARYFSTLSPSETIRGLFSRSFSNMLGPFTCSCSSWPLSAILFSFYCVAIGRRRWLSASLVVLFAVNLLAPAISGRGAGHYFMQVVPFYCILGALGLIGPASIGGLRGRVLATGVAAVAIAFLTLDAPRVAASALRFAQPRRLHEPVPCAAAISDNSMTTDTIWMAEAGSISFYYPETGKTFANEVCVRLLLLICGHLAEHGPAETRTIAV